MTQRISSIAFFGAVALGGGCVAVGTDTSERSSQRSNNPCTQQWQCGANSPILDNEQGFHELHLGGLPTYLDVPETAEEAAAAAAGEAAAATPRGLFLHTTPLLWKDLPFKLTIENNRIVGWDASGVALAGRNLVGAEILLDTTDPTDASPAYRIRIESVREMPFPFPYGSTDLLEVYAFRWDSPAGPRNLCGNPPLDLFDAAAYDRIREASDLGALPHDFGRVASDRELLGMMPEEALLFSGDRIDDTSKTMLAEDPLWFNFGCAGHTLAKLHLTRNTAASRTPTVTPAPVEGRQATLKLLVGDYCGTGRTFTVAGQPLEWKGRPDNARNTYFEPGYISSVEAYWDANGATCLTVPRMVGSTTKGAAEAFPNVWEQINEECRAADRQLLSCGERESWGHDFRVSANPGLPPPTWLRTFIPRPSAWVIQRRW